MKAFMFNDGQKCPWCDHRLDNKPDAEGRCPGVDHLLAHHKAELIRMMQSEADKAGEEKS